jgi:hypothetical protein
MNNKFEEIINNLPNTEYLIIDHKTFLNETILDKYFYGSILETINFHNISFN